MERIVIFSNQPGTAVSLYILAKGLFPECDVQVFPSTDENDRTNNSDRSLPVPWDENEERRFTR